LSGQRQVAKHDLEGAIADYTQALALNPKFAQAFNNRGQARQARAISRARWAILPRRWDSIRSW